MKKSLQTEMKHLDVWQSVNGNWFLKVGSKSLPLGRPDLLNMDDKDLLTDHPHPAKKIGSLRIKKNYKPI
tara:strand:+ start:462 stop:671 length:210 start_codon:yes stop_codon:yes gene_type:complete